MYYIVHLIQLITVSSMKGYLMKYQLFLQLSGMDSLRKNSLSLSLSAITSLFLDLINFLGVISNIPSKTKCACTMWSKLQIHVSILASGPLCYEMLWTLTIFILFYFIFLILYWFCFSFVFLFLLNNEEAHNATITWHVTWCDIIGLEHDGRIWKITSGHMYTTW